MHVQQEERKVTTYTVNTYQRLRKEQLSIRLKSNFPAATSYQLKCWYLDARTAEVFFPLISKPVSTPDTLHIF